MPTPFATTAFWLLVTLGNSGQLAWVNKAELPAPYTSPWSRQKKAAC